MSDESFFREVSEELRQDRVKAIWTRFGALIIGAIVAIVLGTAAYVGWDRYATAQANASGDQYLAALDLAEDGETEEAIAAFRDLSENGWGAYRELARMSIANAQAAAGDSDAAIGSYSEIAGDDGVPQALRDLADLRAAYLLVDTGSLADVRARAERLTGDDNALRYSAREAIGLAAWKAEDAETARDLFQSISDAADAPNGVSQRAGLMIELIASGEPAPATPAADEAAAPDAGTAGDAEIGGASIPSETGSAPGVATPEGAAEQDAAESPSSEPTTPAAPNAPAVPAASADAETPAGVADPSGAADDTEPASDANPSLPAETAPASTPDPVAVPEAETPPTPLPAEDATPSSQEPSGAPPAQ